MNRNNQHIMNAYAFEKIVGEILELSGYSLLYEDTDRYCDYGYDYSAIYDEKKFVFEVKYFSNNDGLKGKLRKTCPKLKKICANEDVTLVIICANIVGIDIKESIMEEYSVHIVDVSNILWILDTYKGRLKDNFISLLEYTIQDVEAVKPNIPLDIKNENNETVDLIDKLKNVRTGKREFAKYEEICIQILKHVFSDYLTSWRPQQKSNNDLYRFDLCCKIKYGEVEEFFDTLKTYFNSKYIIFEFKNYEEEITQKEIYTTEKYLYSKALRSVAIIISRNGADEQAILAAKGCLRENGKLIICLSDEDLVELIKLKNENGERSTAAFLGERLDDLLITLDK